MRVEIRVVSVSASSKITNQEEMFDLFISLPQNIYFDRNGDLKLMLAFCDNCDVKNTFFGDISVSVSHMYFYNKVLI